MTSVSVRVIGRAPVPPPPPPAVLVVYEGEPLPAHVPLEQLIVVDVAPDGALREAVSFSPAFQVTRAELVPATAASAASAASAGAGDDGVATVHPPPDARGKHGLLSGERLALEIHGVAEAAATTMIAGHGATSPPAPRNVEQLLGEVLQRNDALRAVVYGETVQRPSAVASPGPAALALPSPVPLQPDATGDRGMRRHTSPSVFWTPLASDDPTA